MAGASGTEYIIYIYIYIYIYREISQLRQCVLYRRACDHQPHPHQTQTQSWKLRHCFAQRDKVDEVWLEHTKWIDGDVH
jgi:hypothetical protein